MPQLQSRIRISVFRGLLPRCHRPVPSVSRIRVTEGLHARNEGGMRFQSLRSCSPRSLSAALMWILPGSRGSWMSGATVVVKTRLQPLLLIRLRTWESRPAESSADAGAQLGEETANGKGEKKG